ncbi:Testican-1 [Camelus dromedarius]|uniref:Testican-1 n=1 Tax=Camelus dromedarius TaxID=9838 RepID=A0A5N4EBK7_CAMDR|nr:Testican-1 [Camelus dromedarius]
MPAIAVLAAAAAAWCFLQVESRHLDALAGGAGPNNGNFLDNDQWLSTVSQYDRDKYWNRFRDVRPGGCLLDKRHLAQSFQQMAPPLCCGSHCQLFERLPQVTGALRF